MSELKENPFKTTPLTTAPELNHYEGYAAERDALRKAMTGSGVIVLSSIAGFGKTTMAKYFENLGECVYVAPTTYDETTKAIKKLETRKILFWEFPREIKKPVFFDECGALDAKTNALIKAKLHDKGVKVVLILNSDERYNLEKEKQRLTLLDCVLERIELAGFSPEDVEKVIKSRTNAFTPGAIDYLKTRYNKPRDLFRFCHEVFERAHGGEITLEMVQTAEGVVKPELLPSRTPRRQGAREKLLEYIKANPAATFAQMRQADFGVTSASLSVFLSRLKSEGAITQNDNGQYFAVRLGERAEQTAPGAV